MQAALAALAVSAGLVLASGPACAADDGPGPLPWRVGGVLGYTVDAVSFPDSAGTRLEVYVRLRPATLSRLAEDRSHEPRIRFDMRLREDGRGRPRTASAELALDPGSEPPGFGRVVAVTFDVKPGVYELEVRAEARRHVLPGSGTGRPDVARVEGYVVVPERQPGGRISDLEFVWAAGDSATPAVFRRGGSARLPNPEHLYGLFETTLRASFAARASSAGARPWRWEARVLDADRAEVARTEGTAAASARLDADLAFDLSTAPAGGYTLEVRAWHGDDTAPLERRGRFSVAWDPETWTRDPEDLTDEAHLVLARGEEEAFAAMQPGEQERRLAEYWRALDPTPDTAENEARDTFRRRVAFANATYGRPGIGRGMFTDMGRVYIRYGEPSEVHRQVMPGRDNELTRIINRLLTSDDRPVGDLQTQPGADMRPFEIWIYEGEISMPFDAGERGGTTRKLGKPLMFVFIDDQWLGNYRLRYSTE